MGTGSDLTALDGFSLGLGPERELMALRPKQVADLALLVREINAVSARRMSALIGLLQEMVELPPQEWQDLRRYARYLKYRAQGTSEEE